jgi:NhaA family Na+:H+ antiporter
MIRDPFGHAATTLLVACAVLITASVVHRELTAPGAPAGPDLRPRRVAAWPELLRGGHWIGSSSAPVRIVEFSDLQCPFCARTHPLLEEVQRRNPRRVALLYRHYPLDQIHPLARPAALAVECAAEQGAFAALTRIIFAQQDSLGVTPWRGLAARAGVSDLPRFDQCLTSGRFTERVAQDVAAGNRVRIEVTPTLIVNGVLHPGALTPAQLDSLVAGARP